MVVKLECGRPSGPVPTELNRLRAASRLYMAILEDCLPAVDRLGEVGAELGLAIEQALAKEVSGSAARIHDEVAGLLGLSE